MPIATAASQLAVSSGTTPARLVNRIPRIAAMAGRSTSTQAASSWVAGGRGASAEAGGHPSDGSHEEHDADDRDRPDGAARLVVVFIVVVTSPV